MNRVRGSDRAYVLARDGMCTLYRFDHRHVCRDPFGRSHAPTAVPLLSIEHVHDGYGMMGKRAPSDPAHMVALCHHANTSVPSKEARAFFREYLMSVAK